MRHIVASFLLPRLYRHTDIQPVLPHRGQGLNNAICDAAHLLDALKEVFDGSKNLEQAIKEYEDEMRPRGAKEVNLTYQRMLLTAEGRFGESAMANIGFNKAPSTRQDVLTA